MSIRKRLITHLLIILIVVLFVVTGGAYFFIQKDVRFHSKEAMSALAASYEETLGSSSFVPQSVHTHVTHMSHPFLFQIWSNKGQLLLRSDEAPSESLLAKKNDFSTKIVAGKKWMIFTLYSTQYPIKIVIAEDNSLVGHAVVWTDFWIILFVVFAAVLVMIIMVTRTLSSLKKVTQAVASRQSSCLDPVELSGVPKEIIALVQAINHLFMQLKQGFEKEKQFAADAAHELRTPLAALKTQAQVALKAEDAKVRNHALQHVIEGVDRSTHLVQQLLTLSRLMTKTETTLDMDAVQLHKIAAAVIVDMAPQAIEKQIDIELLPAPHEKVIIYGDAKILTLLVLNLIDNAIRYTPTGGSVIVSVEKSLDKAILNIVDTGLGVPEELRHRLFDRFFRVLGNDTTGSGLGFSIIQQVARLHHADIQIAQPKSGKGFEVRVIFTISSGSFLS